MYRIPPGAKKRRKKEEKKEKEREREGELLSRAMNGQRRMMGGGVGV